MPRFRIHLQQNTRHVTIVEADTKDEAIKVAIRRACKAKGRTLSLHVKSVRTLKEEYTDKTTRGTKRKNQPLPK